MAFSHSFHAKRNLLQNLSPPPKKNKNSHLQQENHHFIPMFPHVFFQLETNLLISTNWIPHKALDKAKAKWLPWLFTHGRPQEVSLRKGRPSKEGHVLDRPNMEKRPGVPMEDVEFKVKKPTLQNYRTCVHLSWLRGVSNCDSFLNMFNTDSSLEFVVILVDKQWFWCTVADFLGWKEFSEIINIYSDFQWYVFNDIWEHPHFLDPTVAWWCFCFPSSLVKD